MLVVHGMCPRWLESRELDLNLDLRHSILQGQSRPRLLWTEIWWGMVASVERLFPGLWHLLDVGRTQDVPLCARI